MPKNSERISRAGAEAQRFALPARAGYSAAACDPMANKSKLRKKSKYSRTQVASDPDSAGVLPAGDPDSADVEMASTDPPEQVHPPQLRGRRFQSFTDEDATPTAARTAPCSKTWSHALFKFSMLMSGLVLLSILG